MNQAFTICLLNQKGGVGKSTIAVNIAVEFSKLYKTLIIDCDSQGSCNDFSNARSQIISEKNSLTVCAKPFKTKDGSEIHGKVVRQEIKTFKEDYEVIVIDSPGKASVLGKALASVSDLVIVPITPGHFDGWATDETFQAVSDVLAINDDLEVRVMMNRRDDRTSLSKELRENLEKIDMKMMETTMGNRTVYGKSGGGLSVVEIDDRSVAAQEVINLINEIDSILGIKEIYENGKVTT